MVSQFGVAGGDDNPKTSRLSSPLRWGLFLRFVVAGGRCNNVTEEQFFKAGSEMALPFCLCFNAIYVTFCNNSQTPPAERVAWWVGPPQRRSPLLPEAGFIWNSFPFWRGNGVHLIFTDCATAPNWVKRIAGFLSWCKWVWSWHSLKIVFL